MRFLPAPACRVWQSLLDKVFASHKPGRRRPSLRGYRPRLEALEFRLAPATFTVVNNNDSGTGSLRQAILDANTDAVADTIVFDPGLDGQTITLTSGQLQITEPVSIIGPGASLLTISGNNAGRIFDVHDSVYAPALTVSISGLRLTLGSSAVGGGAIYNTEALTVADCILDTNTSNLGGAIYNYEPGALTFTNVTASGNTATSGQGGGLLNSGPSATMMVTGSTFTGNDADGSANQSDIGGGAIHNADGTLAVIGTAFVSNTFEISGTGAGGGAGIYTGGGTVTITDCNFQANSGGQGLGAEGGGLYVGAGNVTVVDSTFDGNSAGDGGGVANLASLTVTGSTFSNNMAANFGGGLYNYQDTMSVTNSTFVGNTTSGKGGGIYDDLNGPMTLTNVTLGNNSATVAAGGMYEFAASAVTLYNTIAAGNTAAGSPSDVITTLAAASGHNLIGDPNSAGGLTTGTNGNIVGANGGTAVLPLDQILDTRLINHGGPTPMLGLIPGSPALDAGDDSRVTSIPYDQRGAGYPRIVGPHVDIGAFEQRPWAVPTVTVDPAQPNPTHTRSPVVFDVTFSQPVTGFDANEIDFTGSTATGNLAAAITGSGMNYTVTVTGATSDGTVVVAVKAGTGTEGLNADNQNNLPSPSSAAVTIDTVAPTVTVTKDPAQPNPTNAGPILFDVQFDEPVVGFSAADVQLGGTEAGTVVQSIAAGSSPNSYVVTVAGMVAGSQGTVIVTIPAAAPGLTDLAGNPNVASTGTGNMVTFDNVAPTVTIDQAAGQGDPAGGPSVSFNVVFDEPVFGFDGTKVDLTASTAPGTLTATVTGSGLAYTVTVSGMTGGGSIVASIDAGVVTDLAGNPNLSSTSTDNSVAYIHSGTVQFSASTYAINEQGAPILTVTATRTGGSEGSLSVNYTTAGGTAVAGTDFTAASGTLNWAAGDPTSQTFAIPILDDATQEADKAFTVSLSGISLAGALGAPSMATVNILETAGLSLSAANYTVNESDGTATITVKRLFDSNGAVAVHYTTSDGSATQPSDYTTTSGNLSWADGDSADKTFTVPLINDHLSEGSENFNVTLSAATGNADVGPQSTATVTIGKSHGTTIDGTDKKPQSTFTDGDGDLITIKLNGKVGTLTYYLTDGKGPISEIDLVGTDPTKSSVSITVKKPKGGTSDGRVGIGEIDGTGVKTLSLAKADLVGAGINLSSFLGSLSIGAIENGADITLAGAPPTTPKNLATKITAGVIGDGTDIVINGAPLGSLTATSIGVGSITAPSVGSIIIRGKPKTKTTAAIPGDFKSSLTIAGTGLLPKTAALKSFRAAGSLSGSTILVGGLAGTVGDVGSMSAASFVNSQLLAGYTGPLTGTGTFNLPSTVGSFTVTGNTTAFSHSFVIASSFKSVSLASADTTITGTKFGFLYHTSMKALSVKSTKFRFNPAGPAEQDMPSSDFYVKKV